MKLCSLHPTAKSISAVCITPLSQSPRCTSHRQVRLHGVRHTKESIVQISQEPRTHNISKNSENREGNGGKGKGETMHYSVDTISAVCITPPSQSPQATTTVILTWDSVKQQATTTVILTWDRGKQQATPTIILTWDSVNSRRPPPSFSPGTG